MPRLTLLIVFRLVSFYADCRERRPFERFPAVEDRRERDALRDMQMRIAWMARST
jgi:hypothetical protein